MRVRLKTLMAGPAGVHSAGQVLDLPTAQAYALCEGGYAEQVDAPAPAPAATIETASVAPQQAATLATKKPRKPAT